MKGSHWLVGNGASLDIWNSRWLPRPLTFALYSPKPSCGSVSKVSDLIDFEHVRWRESLIWELFLEGDVDTILGILVCGSWPRDKLIWHNTSNCYFTVKSTYHLRLSQQLSSEESSSNPRTKIWMTYMEVGHSS